MDANIEFFRLMQRGELRFQHILSGLEFAAEVCVGKYTREKNWLSLLHGPK